MGKLYYPDVSIEHTHFGYFLKQIPQGSRVLEFGPSTGYMTRYLKEQRNCSVTCVEINPQGAEQAAPFAEKMIVADIDSNVWFNQLKQKYDYILFADVLEHLRDPDKAIQKAVSLLAPGGHMVTSVPNIAHNAILLSLLNGKFEYQNLGLLDDSHIHFFTRKSINKLFNKNGLTCAEERNYTKRPGKTELKEHYCSHPLLSLLLFHKRDGHVYQFICKWKVACQNTPYKPVKGQKVSPFYLPVLCLEDFKDLLRNKYNIHLKNIFKRKM